MARSGPMGNVNQEPCLKKFRPRLCQAMREENLDANQLAAATDMTRPAITQYTNGVRMPYMVALVRLSKTLNRSSDWLLGLTDDPTPKW